MTEQPVRFFYKDFETGKRHWTRGRFIGWAPPTGPLTAPYAQFQRKADVLLVPRSLLAKETRASLPAPEPSSPDLSHEGPSSEKEEQPMLEPMFGDFPKADPVPRGCGEREPGGVYAECGLSDHGMPLEAFLLDSPLPIPDGLDLVNKPQLWQRVLPSGDPILDTDGQPIYDLLIWVGAEHYPYCPDFIEEVRRYGASRRLNPNLDLALLSQASRMILAHPKVINSLWQKQRSPQECDKDIPGHDGKPVEDRESEDEDADEWDEETDEAEDATRGAEVWERVYENTSTHTRALALSHPALPEQPLTPDRTPHTGPCLFKVWELIPPEVAETTITLDGEERPLCLRRIGSTTYQYRSTGESAEGLQPGLFAALPITGFALIQFADGTVNEKAKQKILAGLEAHGTHAVPFYESER